jgi:glycosyltransferase involved in cell wall biosynthesis
MTTTGLPPDLAADSVFIAWGPPAYTNRTRLLAAALGAPVEHIYSIRRRGALAAPIKYPYQAFKTVVYLLKNRPSVILVQNPPSFAAVLVAFACLFSRAQFVVDAHSDAFTARHWSRPRWLYRWVARRATTTIVTNEHFAAFLRDSGGHASVIRDIPSRFDAGSYTLGPEFNIVVVATYAPDEPLEEVVSAARSLPDVSFRVTGDTDRENATIPSSLPPNVELTGFLTVDDYRGLLRHSDAVMALTTRDHTMQRGACEALSAGTPIITSDWPLLIDYFRKGTVHVPNTADGIQLGVARMRDDIDQHRNDIIELRDEVEAEWVAARDGLVALIVGGPSASIAPSTTDSPAARS